MPEDWNAVALEIDAALRSIGDIAQPSGWPVTVRRAGTASGDPWNPTPGTPTYYNAAALETDEELRDINGTLIGQTRRTITISGAAGFVPNDNDTILLGQSIAYVDDATDAAQTWKGILAVRPLKPAGVALLYEIVLAD